MSPAWRFYLGLWAGSSRTIALSTALTLTQVALTLPIAVLLSRLFNRALTPGDIWKIGVSALVLIALYFVGDALSLIANHLSLRITKAVILRLREHLIEAVYRTPVTHSAASETGRIHAALVHDTERVDVMSNSLLSRALPSLLSAVGMLAVLAGLCWQLCLIAILIVPASWAAARLLRRPLQLRIDRFRREFENFSNAAFAVLQRRDLARIQGAEDTEVATLADHSRNVRDAGHRVAWISFANSVAQGEAAIATGILVLLAGSALIASGILTVGMLIAFYFALGLLRSNLSNLFGQLPPLFAGNTALEQLFPILQEPRPEPYGGTHNIVFRGEVALENVSFSYGEERVLADATMLIRPGEVTALNGRSGAGKTTLANLILGLVRPSAGRLLADGEPYDSIKLAALRAKIGYAVQDPIIFAATLRDNLAFGTDGAESRFLEALEITGATEFVSRLPQGLETWMGEKGARLSGGQRQRLSITRAVLRRPTLLVLDEPTNHLGAIEVKAILARFRAACPRTSIVVISHDRDILNAADQLYTLEAGTLSIAAPTKPATLSLAR
jgi:ATP-binding cassette subfamily B protein